MEDETVKVYRAPAELTNIPLRIQELADVEWDYYTLTRVRDRLKKMDLDLDEKMQQGVKLKEPPQPQNLYVKNYAYPTYDEKAYIKRVKELGKGERPKDVAWGLLEIGLVLAQTVILLPVAVICFEAALFALPFCVGSRRKAAWKLYEEDCKEIEARGNYTQALNPKVMAEYERELQQYHEAVVKSKKQISSLPKVQELIREQSKRIDEGIQKMDQMRKELYYCFRVPLQYQNSFAIQMFHVYACEAAAFDIEEAIQRYATMLEEEHITAETRYFKRNRDRVYEIMPAVYDKMDKSEKEQKMLINQFVHLLEGYAEHNVAVDINKDTMIGLHMRKIIAEHDKLINVWYHEV